MLPRKTFRRAYLALKLIPVCDTAFSFFLAVWLLFSMLTACFVVSIYVLDFVDSMSFLFMCALYVIKSKLLRRVAEAFYYITRK